MTRYENQSARVAPAPLPFDDDIADAMDAIMHGREPLTLFTTMARDKRLFFKFMGSGLLDRGHLSLHEREVVIDRVTAQCGAEYEWGVHVATYAKKAQLSDAQLTSLLGGGPTDTCWDPRDRVLICVCDSLQDHCDIDDDLWYELQTQFSAEAAMEILMLAGFYRTVSYLVNGLRLPLEPNATRFTDVSRATG